MANRGNFVDAQSLIDDLNKAFIKHKAVIEESANALIKLEGAYGKLPSDYIRAQKEILDLQNKQIRNESQLETLQKKKIATQEAIARQQNRITKEQERYVQQLEKEKQKLEASQNLYNKVQSKLNALSNEYKNLATKKELGLTLTAKEEQRYASLQSRIQNYDKTLKAVDATMGKYQRNVGNYASAFNPLSNSINQLTREMPAFANSVQTGFMAISNNLPIFFDAITQTKAELQALKAQGQEVPSLFKSIANSFLTWGTALSIGVTLLTVFGDEIVDSIFSTKAKAKADEEAKAVIDKKNEAEKRYLDTMRNTASQEISNAKILFENAKNQNIPLEERIGYIKQLREDYPKYLKNLSDQDILAGNTAKAEERLNEALMKRGIAIALQDKIAEAYKNYADAIIRINNAELAKQNIDEKAIQLAMKLGRTRSQAIADLTLVSDLNIKRAEKDKQSALEEINNLIKLYNTYSPYLNALNDGNDATKKGAKAKREDIEAIKMQDEALKGLIEKLIALKSALEKQRTEESTSREEYDKFTKSINAVQRSIDGLTTGYKDLTQTGVNDFLNRYSNQASKSAKNTEELEKALKSLFQTTANGTLSSFGLDSLIPMFDGTFNKMWETASTFNEKFAVGMKYIGDVAKQTFEFINQQQQAQFDAQFQRLEQERDIALLFAGESATAREEIERQYEERRRQIQRRQAESQKKIAIFNSIVNTAQGVTSALAMANIPLAIVIGALGAIQTAMIASQQIPQFYKGTDNAPEGWAYTQEKGAEIITDKSGKIKSLGSDKGAQLTYLNKGDKVYTAEQSSLMFDYGLNSLLTANGISMPKVDINIDNSITNAKLDEIAKAIKEKDSILVSRDRRGEELYKINNGNRQKLINTRLKIGKFDV